jgi:hypothetical protein
MQGVSSLRRALFAIVCLSLLALLAATVCPAATVPVGVVSFDIFIPPDTGSPGVNVFTIANLTGDPASGGFALPPEFPVFSSLAFLDAQLTIDGRAFDLGDIGPGSVSPDTLLFPDTDLFSAATFSATISQTTLTLDDGRTFRAASPRIVAALTATSGTNLQPGIDFVLITVSEIPEPGTYSLALAAFCALVTLRRRFKRIFKS